MLDCRTCGACCREAYETVPLTKEDLLRKLRPEWVSRKRGFDELPRLPGGSCPALSTETGGYRCGVYEERPEACRSFVVGGRDCLAARQSIGVN